MKNKKLILGGSIILGGGLFAYLFLRKKPTSLSGIKPELNTSDKRDNLPIQKDVLETSVVQKDTTKEEFDMYYKTYRGIKQQIVELEKPPKLTFPNNKFYVARVMEKRDQELTSARQDLMDYEQKIIDLGYTPTGRGTFIKQ